MYQVYQLKCSGIRQPAGLDCSRPELSWRLQGDASGIRQAAWQVQVWNQDGVSVWDSGRQVGSTVSVYYGGTALTSHSRYSWQVTSYSNQGDEAVSEKASFTTGMLEPHWNAAWIEAPQERKPIQDCTEMWKMFAGIVTSHPHPEEFLNPAVCLRWEITIAKPVQAAYLYASAHGVYQLKVDGTAVSEFLAPGYTAYGKYLEIQQYDVTQLLGQGDHALAITLADGWYTGKIGLPGVGNQYGETNAFYLQGEIFYTDGTHETIGTGPDFKWHESPYEYADLIVGERYRDGYLDSAWELPHYDDSSWGNVLLKDYPTDVFHGRTAEPVRLLRTQKPAALITTPKGELVLDAGANIVGGLKLHFLGEAGTELKLTHSEELDKEGNFLMNIMGQNKNQMDVYLCSKTGEVTYQPFFTVHGFRYARIEGISREQLLDADVLVYGTDLERTGTFTCSDPRLNQLQENIFRSQQGNMLSIPTDCPQRERAGWTGDMQVYTPTACFNMDVYSFLRKWLANMRLEQRSDGQIPNIIPTMPSDKLVGNSTSEHDCSAAWGDACIIIPLALYQKYGKKEILEENFSMIQGWMNYVERQAATSFPKPAEEYTPEQLERQKYLWNTEFHFGDWLYPSATKEGMGNPVETALTTKEYVAPAYFAYTSGLMAQVCEILHKDDLAARYRDLQQKIQAAYAAEYISPDGDMPLPLQGLYVLALAFDLLPTDQRAHGVEMLTKLIHKNGDHLDTGFASIAFLLDTLWDNGEKELAYRLLFQEDCPSWLYEVKMGATTIWESWNAILPDGTRTNSSYNHFAFGCVGDFLYRKILGLNGTKPGYETVDIAPDLACGLESAQGTYETVYGQISVSWKRDSGKTSVDIQLPPGVTGTLHLGGQSIPLDSGASHHTVQP